MPDGNVARNFGTRVALVMGVEDYENLRPLRKPLSDARAVADALNELGFELVQSGEGSNFIANPKREEALEAREDFMGRVRDVDIALFYFAGHGVQVDGRNYLLLKDSKVPQRALLQDLTLPLEPIVERMRQRARNSIVILDACRNDPFQGRFLYDDNDNARDVMVGPQDGLAGIKLERGSVTEVRTVHIIFATAPGTTAADSVRGADPNLTREIGDHSPFTAALLKHIRESGISVSDMVGNVSATVQRWTRNDQQPWYNALLGPVVRLNPLPTTRDKPPGDLDPAPSGFAGRKKNRVDIESAWLKAGASNDPDVVKAFLDRYPNAPMVAEAQERLLRLVAERPNAAVAMSPVENPPAYSKWTWGLPALVASLVLGFVALFLWHEIGTDRGDTLIERIRFEDRGDTLIVRIRAFDEADLGLARDVDAFLNSSAALKSKSRVVDTVVKLAQFHIIESSAPDDPSDCHSLSDFDSTAICAGLGAGGLKTLLRIMSDYPLTRIWEKAPAPEQRRLAILAFADLAARNRAEGAVADPEVTMRLKALGGSLVTPRPSDLVALQFGGAVRRGNAQAIADRLVSLGWKVPGVDFQIGAAGHNEIRYGSNPSNLGDAILLETDLALQGLSASPVNNFVTGANANQLNVYISTPLVTWEKQPPGLAWCYQEFDGSKSEQTRYLVACYPSKPACANARRNPLGGRQSQCLFSDLPTESSARLKIGGRANAWYTESASEISGPFPQLPSAEP
ncbi:caspase family protein [Mesorhizobium sp.]|uniref:caspase family protein n=1 Tax=Mesorhizobium sp. TaxID=1871066 RepID=UPI000FE4D2FC|nr:caspase family protein [Mesorhizobium sp.]RWP51089.1 MAG: caspase family protein [Mesorhizobium sp.]